MKAGQGIRRSARWLVAESLVVALGVFAALLADSWRQSATEKAAENRALAALSIEFHENRAQLETQFEVYRRRSDAIGEILHTIRSGSLLPEDSLDHLFRWSLRTGSYDPSNGTLTSILASGDLQLIRDTTLRRLLARWPAEVDNFSELEAFYNEIVLRSLRPHLRMTVGLPSGMGENDFPPNSTDVDLRRALADPILEQVLRELQGYGVVLTQGTAGQEIVRLLDDLQAALPPAKE